MTRISFIQISKTSSVMVLRNKDFTEVEVQACINGSIYNIYKGTSFHEAFKVRDKVIEIHSVN